VTKDFYQAKAFAFFGAMAIMEGQPAGVSRHEGKA
jgi:hypothetical protein